MSKQRRIDDLLAHYRLSHQHPHNEAIHCVAVPVIMASLVGLLWSVHPTLVVVFLLASGVYYARLGLRTLGVMALWTAAVLAVLWPLGESRWWVSALAFVLAWIAQFVGHRIEGKKPSFFEDLQYLWVGPLFVADVLLRRLGWRW
ncbi:MAG: hypothetical protein RL297_1937 [Pseudomonadota bacterium]|jgi:uncharacterized membrane protein YGL010W